MRILFFSEPAWPLHPGGAGRCSFLYAAELVRRGHRVFLVCPGDLLVAEVIEGVEIHRVPHEPSGAPRNVRTEENAFARVFLNYARDHILPLGVDLVVDVGGFLSYFFSVTFEIRRRWRIPVIVHFHLLEDNPERDPRHFLNRIAPTVFFDFDRGAREHPQCFAVRAADTVICLTERDAETVQRLYRPARIRVLPPPVDPRLATAKQVPPRGLPRAAGAEHIIIFAGRVDDHNKGAAIVRSAIKRVLAVRTDVRLVVIGPADADDFADLGWHVTRAGWINDSATLAGWFRAADVLVMPSRFEAFGMMCAEALAMGLPVIGSPVGGLPEMVAHGRNGYLLKAHDPRGWPKEISRLILQLLENPSLLAQMKAEAASAVARFDVVILGAELEKICRETLEGRHQIPPLSMPAIGPEARSQYLGVLSYLGGREARLSGEALLPLIRDESETRCLSCCRRGILSNVRRVAGAAKVGGPKGPLRIRRAVFSTCPWSLVSLKEQARMAIATGRVTFIQIWWSRLFFFVVRRLLR